MSVCLQVFLTAFQYECLFAYLHICMSAFLYACMPSLYVFLYACMPSLYVFLYACMSVFLYFCIPACQAFMYFCMPACQSLCISVCLVLTAIAISGGYKVSQLTMFHNRPLFRFYICSLYNLLQARCEASSLIDSI